MKKNLILLTYFFCLTINCIAQSKEYVITKNSSAIQIQDFTLADDSNRYLLLNHEYSLILTKLNPQNDLVWSKAIAPNMYASCSKITVSGNFIYISYVSGIDLAKKILKLDSNGNLVWEKAWYSTSYGAYDIEKRLIVDSENNILSFIGDYEDTKILKLDQNGNKIFSKRIVNDTTVTKNPSFDLIRCENGNYILTAKEESTCVISKLDENMSKIWSKIFPLDYYNHPKTAIELEDHKILVAGYSDDLDGYPCIYSLLLDPNGNLLQKNYYIDNYNYLYPREMKLIGNEIYFWNEINILGKMNLQGELIEIKQFDYGTSLSSSFYSFENYFKAYNSTLINFKDVNNVKCVPLFNIPFPMASERTNDASFVTDAQFFVKPLLYDSLATCFTVFENVNDIEITEICNSLSLEESNSLDIGISPNPTTSFLSISNSEQLVSYSIYDMNSRKIQSAQINSVINVSNLTPGVYLINLTNSENQTYTKKFIKE